MAASTEVQRIHEADLLQEGYPFPDNVVIQWWNAIGHKDLGMRNALKAGHSVIVGTNNYTYLNFPITPWSGYKADRTFDIQDIYERNPSNLDNPDPLVLGMGASLWTDYKVTKKMIDRRVFPQIFAIAHQAWSGDSGQSFADFYKEVSAMKPIFESLGLEFGPGPRSEVPADYSWE